MNLSGQDMNQDDPLYVASDWVVPDEMTDKRAAAAAPGKARVVKLPGGHYVVFDEGDFIWNTVSRFIRSPDRSSPKLASSPHDSASGKMTATDGG
jgi:hypothetical protein